MQVLKIISFKKGIDTNTDMYILRSSELTLVKLGLIEDPCTGKNHHEAYRIERELCQKDATIYTELVDESYRYNRCKMRYLDTNAYKTEIFDKTNRKFVKAYVLPAEKADLFLKSDFKPECKKIEISLCQTNVPTFESEEVHYIAFYGQIEEYGEYDIHICVKSEYTKEWNHYGRYIDIKIIKPYIMWGTQKEIEKDIKRIILKEIKERELIDFLKN